MAEAKTLSIVVPLFNEESSVAPLVEAVRGAVGREERWELILIDDGSSDGTAARASEMAVRDPRVRVFRLARNYGQAIATQVGFDHAEGGAVVTMDGDLQNDPRDIHRLLSVLDKGFDLVAGYRVNRQDRLLTRKMPSWIANRMIRALTGIRIRDTGCSLRAYRLELVKEMALYADMHRFIPAVAAGVSGVRITEVPVRHHPRRFGESNYGLRRVWQVLGDLLMITPIRWFRERPLMLFAIGASGALFLAGLAGIGTGVVTLLSPGSTAGAVVLPGTTLVLLGLAFYLIMLGLIAEVAVHRSRGDRVVETLLTEVYT